MRVMKKTKSSPVTLGDVAKAAGVSGPAASYALRNRPGVSAATRDRVQRIAKKLGYLPDARITGWMARMQEAKTKDLLPIAWLNTHVSRNEWRQQKYLSPYFEGARERCGQLGYRLEEIWTHEPGMSLKRIGRMLYQRGIEGAIVTPPARHLRIAWDRMACVILEGSLLVPDFSRVMSDLQFNLELALRTLKRHGYRRIGICMTEYMTNYLHQSVRFTMLHHDSTAPAADRVLPLLHPNLITDADKRKQVIAWLKRQRPHVIIGYDNRLVEWCREAGFRVPQDLGVVHLAIDDDVRDWAGIDSHRKIVGRTVAEQVIALIQNRQFGVPSHSFHTLIRGAWSPGWTLSAQAPAPRPRLLTLK